LEGDGEGNMGEIGGSMRNWEICRKEPVVKMMDEHHFAGIPKGRRQYRCFFGSNRNFYKFIPKPNYSRVC
jgi:hypothetical protein